ncbi:MAG: hypothetical protein CMF31_06540 [Kordiimonas sp.]|nr:hypothetical protein [Kordiimonas sp.]|tara:strand:- start:2542 stop:3042 length:501 start_codon:yes stop_codon:yes gene_type:complete
MPAPSKIQHRRSTREVRETILKEATRLFLEKGYVGASMNELTERVGGSKSTLYKQFGNKEALFTAVLNYVLDQHMQQLNKVALNGLRAADKKTPNGEAPVRKRLEEIGILMLTTVSSEAAVGMWRLLYSEGPHHPEIANTFVQNGPEKSLAKAAGIIDNALAKGPG